MEIKSLKIIEVIWDGPFKLEEVANKKGLYQVYGSHPVNGTNNLLYIGLTADDFKKRTSKHNNDWIGDEASNIDIYYGKIDGSDTFSDDLNTAEELLIYYCAPPYNSHHIYDLKEPKSKEGEHTLVLNLFKRNLLPYEVSTLWHELPVWEGEGKDTPKTHNFEVTKTSG